MTTLGQRLQQSIVDLEQKRLAALQREAATAEAKAQAHRQAVGAALAELRRRIEAAIALGDLPRPMRLPKVLDNDHRSWEVPIDNCQHRDHQQWLDQTATWAAGEDLLPTVEYANDGMGMESWWCLSVAPRIIMGRA